MSEILKEKNGNSDVPFNFSRQENRIVISVFNRIEMCNALSFSVLFSFIQMLKKLEKTEDVRVLIIQGNGRHFCSGLDLSEASRGEPLILPESEALCFLSLPVPEKLFQTVGKDGGERLYQIPKSFWMPRLVAEVLWRLVNLPQIVIGAAHGGAFGGGGGILSCCDIAMASPDLKIGFPESRRGLSTGLLHPFLKRRLPPACVTPLLLTGMPIDAAEALRIGLIDKILEEGESREAAALKKANEILQGEPSRIIEIKKIGNAGRNPTEREVLNGLLDHWKSWNTPAAEEGVRAFFEKRPPVWK